LNSIEQECVYSICDSAIDLPILYGGEWVNTTEIDGKLLRLSIIASYDEGKDNMNSNNFTWVHPKEDSIGCKNPYDELFPISNYNELPSNII